jgi:hypothetical protein
MDLFLVGGIKKLVTKSITTMDEVVDPEAVCYLCLDGGLDDAGQPLRRDCACRGTDAGFVHLSCLTNYAETKSKQALYMNEFINPWRECPGCHQYYQNELSINIATNFVSFVQSQYPKDIERQVEALYVKLGALDNMLDTLQSVQKREADVVATVLLSLIDRIKSESPPLHMRYSQFQAFAYNIHGCYIALDEGTEESARRAVVHYEKCLKVCEAIGDADGFAAAKGNIAFAKSKYEGGNNNEEVLKASKELYEMRVAEYGEEHELTIDAGVQFATVLQNANRWGEAMELLMKLLATSKQVLGPHHNINIHTIFNQVICC